MKFSGTPWRRCQSCRIQKNGFLQCLVLAPILFNLRTNDLPVAACRKFIYADDICLGKQARTCAELEGTLTAATARMEEYCRCWRLKPSISKTVQRVVQECCKGKDESLSRRGKFAPPPPPQNPLTDCNQNMWGRLRHGYLQPRKIIYRSDKGFCFYNCTTLHTS